MGVGFVVSTLGSALATYLVLQRSHADEMAFRVDAASGDIGEALGAARPLQLRRALTKVADASNVRAVFAYSRDGALLATQPPGVSGPEGVADGGLVVEVTVVVDERVVGRIVVVASSRGILAQSWLQASIIAMASIVSLLIAAALAALLQRSISRPIVELSNAARRIEREADFSGNVDVEATGETEPLVDAFNAMLQRLGERDMALRQAHTSLVRASREAGMAEVATGILHNVGNVLNSINTSAEVAVERVKGLSLEPMQKAVALAIDSDDVGKFLTEDARGTKVLPYLAKSIEHAFKQRDELLSEMGQIREGMDHVKEIVARQRAYAGAANALDTCGIVELVEDSLALVSDSIKKHHVEVIREFVENPTVRVDRHWSLQILVNLVSNACEALEASPSDDRKLTVSTALDGDHYLIRVSDNGAGIAPGDLQKLFAQGFTTKTGGLGFGLHDSIIAVRQMKGTLTAESEGLGCGATFVVRLPFAHPGDD